MSTQLANTSLRGRALFGAMSRLNDPHCHPGLKNQAIGWLFELSESDDPVVSRRAQGCLQRAGIVSDPANMAQPGPGSAA